MEKYRNRAKNLFESGYNCAQAVFLTFAEELGVDFKTASAISAPFGGGMGRMREVCGAVSGMFMALGVLYGDYGTDSPDTKKQQYADVQRLAAAFEERNGSIICRELLGLDEKVSTPVPEKRTAKYYAKRPCAELVYICAKAVEEHLENIAD